MTRTARVFRHMLGWTRGETYDFSYLSSVDSSVNESLVQDDSVQASEVLNTHQRWDIRAWPEKRYSRLVHRSLREKEFALACTRERRQVSDFVEEQDTLLLALRSSTIYLAMWESSEQKEREKNLRKLEKAETQDEVLAVLKGAGFSKQEKKLRQDLADRKEGLEDGEHPGIRFESLHAVARFMVSNHELSFSSLKVDFSGSADLSWYLSPRQQEHDGDDKFWVDGGGQITLRFVTPNLIEFAMLSGPWTNGAERLSLTGTMSHKKMRIILDMFSKRMISYNE